MERKIFCPHWPTIEWPMMINNVDFLVGDGKAHGFHTNAERLPVYIWKNGSQTGTSAAIMSGIFCKILQFQWTQVFWPRWPLIMSTFLSVQRKGHFRKGLPRHCWLYKGQSLWWMRGWGQCKQTKKAFQLIKDLFIAIFKRNTNLVISVHIHITKEKISERRDKRCWYISEMHRTCCQQVLFLHSECGV